MNTITKADAQRQNKNDYLISIKKHLFTTRKYWGDEGGMTMNTYKFLETFFNGSTNFRVLIVKESDRATLLDFEISKLQKIFFTNATKEMASIYNAPICWANFYNGDLFVVVDLEED